MKEVDILRCITNKMLLLNKPITRQKLASRFLEKTGRIITHLQRISDIRTKLGLTWQKPTPRTPKQRKASTTRMALQFVRRERRKARRRQWFIDQIKLPDAEVVRRSYGKKGQQPAVKMNTVSSGTGTGICACNWEYGFGPVMYVRNAGAKKGTTREHVMMFLREQMLPVVKEGDTIYLDNAGVNQDKKYRAVEAIFSDKKVEVKYLPPNSTHMISPLDQQPFARLRELWMRTKGKNAKTAARALNRAADDVSLECVRKGIKSAGF